MQVKFVNQWKTLIGPYVFIELITANYFRDVAAMRNEVELSLFGFSLTVSW